MDLNGKSVIYLGGFGGIGKKCVREFLVKGIKNLAIFDQKQDADVLKEWQEAFPDINIFFVKTDITKKDNIEAAYNEAFTNMSHFDVVVNGFGLMDDRLIDLTIQINLLGVIHSTLTAIKFMDRSVGGRGGLIINISSVVGLEPTGMFAVYSASKFGVTAFTRSLANPFYNLRTGIGFVTICPGFTDTTLLEHPQDTMTFSYATLMIERFKMVKRQSAEECAKNIVKVVEVTKNGAVWMLDMGQMKEVEFPVMWEPTLNF